MLRITTLNANGLRSASAKGLHDWLARRAKADVVCLQEVRAHEADLDRSILAPRNYHGVFHCAAKKGYSGVAIYTREKPDAVSCGFGSPEFDAEGRYLRVDFGKLSIVSVYFPSGSSSQERQLAKFRFLDAFVPIMRAHRESDREWILCGDVNIAHKEIDLRNWRSNQKNSGFLPEERAWMSARLDGDGWVDVFRRIDPRPDQYTWWSNRGQSWAKNVGWRIDYHLATPGVGAKAKRVAIYKDERFSDHAPLTIDYDL